MIPFLKSIQTQSPAPGGQGGWQYAPNSVRSRKPGHACGRLNTSYLALRSITHVVSDPLSLSLLAFPRASHSLRGAALTRKCTTTARARVPDLLLSHTCSWHSTHARIFLVLTSSSKESGLRNQTLQPLILCQGGLRAVSALP